jgi:hypothetical protein
VPDETDADRSVELLGQLLNQFGEFKSSTEQVLSDLREGMENGNEPAPKAEPKRTEGLEDDALLDALERTTKRLELLRPE